MLSAAVLLPVPGATGCFSLSSAACMHPKGFALLLQEENLHWYADARHVRLCICCLPLTSAAVHNGCAASIPANARLGGNSLVLLCKIKQELLQLKQEAHQLSKSRHCRRRRRHGWHLPAWAEDIGPCCAALRGGRCSRAAVLAACCWNCCIQCRG